MTNKEINLPSDIIKAHFVINELTLKNQELQQQVDWFKRQLFGEKSEKVVRENGALEQLWLGGEAPEQTATIPSTTIKEHVRKRRGKESLAEHFCLHALRFRF